MLLVAAQDFRQAHQFGQKRHSSNLTTAPENVRREAVLGRQRLNELWPAGG